MYVFKLFKKYKEHRKRVTNYIDYLKNKGISIGENTLIAHEGSIIDLASPFLITIGKNVCIASHVTIMTHDCAQNVIVRYSGEITGGAGPVNIGDNVYIAMHTTILRNSQIGNNVIIGANSLVHGKLEDNSIYAGNPAIKISSLEDYIEKVRNRQVEEASEIFLKYYKLKKEIPDESIFSFYNYEWLWTSSNGLNAQDKKILNWAKNFERPFKSYSEFSEYCLKKN